MHAAGGDEAFGFGRLDGPDERAESSLAANFPASFHREVNSNFISSPERLEEPSGEIFFALPAALHEEKGYLPRQ